MKKESLYKMIDFVLLWVDGNDPKWLEEKNKYFDNNNAASNGTNRFRDWGLLQYWFRGVEKFAPWVNKIHFVTWGHIPDWLDTSNPKLNIVKHEEFIPKEFLPTFNSNVIQYYLDRIPGIADKFVMFDDDMFLIEDVKEKDFFIEDKICDTYGEKEIYFNKKGDKYPHCLVNNIQVVNQYYSKKNVYKKHPFKYFNFKYGFKVNIMTLYLLGIKQFNGIYSGHICQAYTKKAYSKFWEYCGDELKVASKNRFREATDFSTFLVRYIELLDGDFVPRSVKFGKRIELGDDNRAIYKAIKKQRCKVLCINDSKMNYNFDEVQRELKDAFKCILPENSSFEKNI